MTAAPTNLVQTLALVAIIGARARRRSSPGAASVFNKNLKLGGQTGPNDIDDYDIDDYVDGETPLPPDAAA